MQAGEVRINVALCQVGVGSEVGDRLKIAVYHLSDDLAAWRPALNAKMYLKMRLVFLELCF